MLGTSEGFQGRGVMWGWVWALLHQLRQGLLLLLSCFESVLNRVLSVLVSAAVYHVTADGWKKVRGDDVTECHFEYYPDPAAHPSAGTPVI